MAHGAADDTPNPWGAVVATLKRPAFQFYPADWRKDLALRTCSIGARGLWVELMATMHEGTPYGHLALDGEPLSDEEAASLAGIAVKEYTRLLAELERRKVFSRNEAGVIYSRRMVRDEDARNKRALGGDGSTREATRKSEPSAPRGGVTGRLFNFLLTKFHGCLWCGSKHELELHRIVPGRHHGKYEPGNVLLLCRAHHIAVEHRDLTVEQILSRHSLLDATTLFAGYDEAKSGKADTRDRIPTRNAQRVSDSIPSGIPNSIPPSPSSSSSASATPTPNSAVAELPPLAGAAAAVALGSRLAALGFTDPRHLDAARGYLRSSAFPDAVIAHWEGLREGLGAPGGAAVEAATLGQALHEMRVASVMQHSSKVLAKFLAGVGDGPAHASASEADAEAAFFRRVQAGDFLPPELREAAHE